MNKLIRKILRKIFSSPKRKLTWSVEDFRIAKNYAKRLDHPNVPSKSYWDYINNPWNDSVDILHFVNRKIELDNFEKRKN